jgi:putative glutamine amidotransferase
MASADGVLFSGGNDMNPLRYGQRPRPQTVLLDPAKEASDFRHLAAALEAGLPVLGICHGAQLLNVARGGTLFQDIPTQLRGALPHRPRKTGDRCLHPVHVRAGSGLRGILRRPDIVTNSSHHQAINVIGRGLEAVAWAPDGVIEAVEDPSRPFVLGVQWHPERMTGRAARHVIRALVRAAGRGT